MTSSEHVHDSTHAHDHVHDTRDADQDNRDLLRGLGLRATPQRLGVLRAFRHANGRHLSADDVWQFVRAHEIGLDRSTAYRIVAGLTDAGLLKEVRFHDGVARFEVQTRHHHHAVCTRCGASVDVTNDAMNSLRKELMAAYGFVLTDDPQLLAGLCADCAPA